MTETLLQVVQLQAQYHNWATREMWAGLADLPEKEFTLSRGTSFDTLQATLNHMFAADCVWVERLKGNGAAQLKSIVVPKLSELSDAWFHTLDELIAVTAAMTEPQIYQSIEYSTSAGGLFKTPTWQVLLHVVNHSTGHRGQVNGLIREAGGTPCATDLILFYRARDSGSTF
jgi:uncharacterized damage-inducible protein DinB